MGSRLSSFFKNRKNLSWRKLKAGESVALQETSASIEAKTKRLLAKYSENPNNPRAAKALADHYVKVKNNEQAIHVLEAFLSLESQNTEGKRVIKKFSERLGYLLLKAGQAEQAERIFRELEAEYPQEYTDKLAQTFFSLKEYDQALFYAEKLLAKYPNDPDAILRFVETSSVLGHRSRARKVINTFTEGFVAATKSPKATVKSVARLAVYLVKTDYQKEAEILLRKVLPELPNNVVGKKALMNCLCKQLRFEEALEHCNEIMKEDPTNFSMYLRLADIFSGLNQPAKAAKALESYMQFSGDAGTYSRFATLNRQKAGKYSEDTVRTLFFAENALLSQEFKLDNIQQKILDELNNSGIAVTSVAELFGAKADAELIAESEKQFLEFRSRQDISDLVEGVTNCEDFSVDPRFKNDSKPSVIRYADTGNAIKYSDPLVAPLLSSRVLSIANAYNGMLSRIRNVNCWVNPTITGKNLGLRKGSQLWHRDQEDEKILKCFIYFSDVTEESGALDYVKFSKCTGGLKHHNLHPFPSISGYPGQYIFDEHIDEVDIVSATGKKGMIVFVDTNGFHRGGYVTVGERRVIMGTYLRPSSPALNKCEKLVLEANGAERIDVEALYALS